MSNDTADCCPECGESFTQSKPYVHRGRGGPEREGTLPQYLLFEDGTMYLHIEFECPNCGWEYAGRLAFQEVDSDE